MPRKGEASKRKGKPSENSGMKGNQKLKPFLILKILQQQSDETHLMTIERIIDKLAEYGVAAERRSVGEDIKAINAALLLLDERYLGDDTITLEDAIATLKEDASRSAIVYVSRDVDDRGYYFKGRKFDFQQVRLLAETIYNAKILSETDADRLSLVLDELMSEHQAKAIRNNAYVTDRIRGNRSIIANIEKIDDAMATKLDGEKHIPEKIKFQYSSYAISGLKQVDRRNGEYYKVSPYKVIVTDGNYYLLAFDDKTKKIRTFRVDRMKNVSLTNGEPREGKEEFAAIDLKNFTRERFGMFDGRRAYVTIRCINPLLDAMVERFGTQNARYNQDKEDKNHFTVSAWVRVSDQFFGWLLGFGNRVKLVGDDETVKEFAAYLDKVKVMY